MNYRIFKVLCDLAMSNPGMIKSQGQVFKMAAAISDKRGDIVVTGINQIKSHPIMLHESYQRKRQVYLHAEADAIRKSCRRFINATTTTITTEQPYLTKYTMHVLRVKRNPKTGEWMLGNARPCDGCMGLIMQSGIKQVFWTEDGPLFDDDSQRENMDLFQRHHVFYHP